MSKSDHEARIAALEAELARLKAIIEKPTESEEPWWKKLAGKYANDPTCDEATRLGREYRESLRPKPRARKKV